MRFRILGPLRVRDGAQWISVRAAQQRLVLAVLLIDVGKVVSTDQLVNEIWGEQPPGTAAATVRGYVYALRRILGGGTHGPLLTRGNGYELVVADEDVDARVFERLVDTGIRAIAGGDRHGALPRLSEALALCDGQVLADVPASETVATEVNRLEQRRLTAVEERFGVLLDLGRHAEMVDELAQVVAEHPLRERLQGQLMLALHRCGRRAEALAAYRGAHRMIIDELGVQPGTELRRLHQALLADEPHLVVPVQRGSQDHRVTPAQLPAEVTAFTGRERPLRQLDTLLPTENGTDDTAGAVSPVIVTIVGTAGVGKTALAMRWAHQVRRRFPDGQLYVNLHGYAAGPPMRPIDALARFLPALGVPAEQVPLEVDVAASLYRSLLADKRILVLLDDVAHSDQVRPLLPGSRGCRVLLTSRDKLGGLVARDGAVPLTLDALDPAESMTLLTRLLGAARVENEPDAAAALTDLCGHLPLALRIAAANLTARPTHAIADYTTRLAGGDRLAALQMDGDPRVAVRTAFDHSYAALPDDAALLFRRLGLVPGTEITAPAAAALAGVSLPQATRLLDRLARGHLIVEHTRDRYTLHDLWRRYAADLAAGDRTLDRAAALDRLHDHLFMRMPTVTRSGEARTFAGLGAFDGLDGLDGALDTLTRILAPHRPSGDREAGTPRLPATVHRDAGRSDQALDLTTTAPPLAPPTGDRPNEADALNTLATIQVHLGRPEQAIHHHRQALGIARGTGNRHAETEALAGLAATYRAAGHHDQAAEAAGTALTIARRCHFRLLESDVLTTLAAIRPHRGTPEEAVDPERAPVPVTDTGHRPGPVRSLIGEQAVRRAGCVHGARAHHDLVRALSSEMGDDPLA